ncbi:Twinkle protein, mitochondrial, partial [Zancudomyces culisetae]
GSFEIPNTRLASRMLAQFAGEDLSTKPEAQLRKHMSRFMGLPMYFLKFHGSTNPDTVIETMRHAVYAYDVKHIIIDNLQFMMSVHGHTKFSGDKYDLQDAAVASFRRFATEQRVHITLVVHIRKEQSSSSLDLNSIFGSAKTTQEADNVLMLQKLSRSSSKRYLEVLKNRYDGTLGKIYLSYDKDSSSIKQIAEPPPRQRNVKLIRPATGLDELTQLRISESTELL